MQRLHFIILTVAVVCISGLVSAFDSMTRVDSASTLIVYPFFASFIFFTFYHTEHKWFFMILSLLVWGLFQYVPLFLLLIPLVLLYAADRLLSSTVAPIALIFIFSLGLVISMSISVIMQLTPGLLSWYGWAYLQTEWSITHLFSLFGNIIFTTLLLLLVYPWFVKRDAQRKQYTHS